MKTPKVIPLEVVSNVPIPELYGRYPFERMKVGDSFYYEGTRSKLATNAASWAARHGNGIVKFSTRKEGNGFRCWRIK